MDLKGKVVVVTGAARGIGQAVAQEYAHRGARVVLADISVAAQQEAVSRLQESGHEAYSFQVDVAKDNEVKQFAAQVIKEVGVPDIVHNNAAIIRSGSIIDIEIEDLLQQMDVNVFGYLRVTQAFVRAMIERGQGKIVITASPNGLFPAPMVSANLAAYCLCKAADVSMAQCLAATLKPHGITVSVLFPDMTFSDGIGKIEGKASDEFHQAVGQHMATNGVAAEVNARGLIDGVQSGAFFVSAHPSIKSGLAAWASNGIDPLKDWLDPNTGSNEK